MGGEGRDRRRRVVGEGSVPAHALLREGERPLHGVGHPARLFRGVGIDLVRERHGALDRLGDGDALDPLREIAAGADDADQPPLRVDQRAAGVAGVERHRELDQPVVAHSAEGPARRGGVALAHVDGVAGDLQRLARRDPRRRLRQGHRVGQRAGHLHVGDVVLPIDGRDHARVLVVRPGEDDRQQIQVAHHVGRGEHAPVAADDHAGAVTQPWPEGRAGHAADGHRHPLHPGDTDDADRRPVDRSQLDELCFGAGGQEQRPERHGPSPNHRSGLTPG